MEEEAIMADVSEGFRTRDAAREKKEAEDIGDEAGEEEDADVDEEEEEEPEDGDEVGDAHDRGWRPVTDWTEMSERSGSRCCCCCC